MSVPKTMMTSSVNQIKNQTLTQQELLGHVRELSMRERLSLVEQILAEIIPQLPMERPTKKHLRSLQGLWQGFNVTEDDISEARREMWGDFGDRL